MTTQHMLHQDLNLILTGPPQSWFLPQTVVLALCSFFWTGTPPATLIDAV